MENEEEIPKLRELYDELWHDAKTMIRDMKEGISMYKFSGIFICLYAYFAFWITLTGSLKIIAGGADLTSYFNAFFGAFAIVFFALFGLRLIRFYYKLKERYAKLLEMEKKIED